MLFLHHRFLFWDYYNEFEIMDLMNNIEYGYVDKEGRKYTKEFDDFADLYILQTPKEIEKSKVGVCWDQVELERYYFKGNDWNIKTYFLVYYDGDKCPTHTFLTFEKNNKYYWFEHSWERFRGIHEYESLKKELAERIDEATAAIEKLNKEKREILDGVSKQQSWVEQFRQYENVTELTRPMVIHLIERINIFEDSNIEIVFRHRNQIEEILQFISEKTANKKVLAIPIREVG